MDRGDEPAQGAVRRAPSAPCWARRGRAGVPVPAVVAMGDAGVLGAGLAGGRAPRGRDHPAQDPARPRVGRRPGGADRAVRAALAAIHTIDPDGIEGLPPADPFRDPLPFLDALGEVRPALELGVRWLEAHRPAAGRRVTVHGDFRSGNLLVGPDGLRGVLDWELAHAGDPAEDIGWLCAPAWRFGGPGEVGGFGALDELLEAYAAAGGEAGRAGPGALVAGLRHGEVGHHLRPAGLGAPERLDPLGRAGRHRAAGLRERVGPLRPARGGAARRPPRAGGGGRGRWLRSAGRRRPSWSRRSASTSSGVMEAGEGGARFEARVARNALRRVERELRLGPAIAAAHAARLRGLGFADDAALAAAIRAGRPRRRTGSRWRRRWPRRPAISCWWPTPPTCRRPARRRVGGRSASAEADVVGHLGAAGPMPWRTRPASRLQATMKIQAWWKRGHRGRPGGACPRMATRQATPRARPIWRHMA